jgi:hypothetical protein
MICSFRFGLHLIDVFAKRISYKLSISGIPIVCFSPEESKRYS